jgi:hypothetical protein
MVVERIVTVKRTIWVAECPNCHDRSETTENPPKERFCSPCGVWVPYVELSYTGKDY